jgi:esterase/lipase superfamily enzyme
MSFGSVTITGEALSDPPTMAQLRAAINQIGKFPDTPYDIEPTRAGYLRAPDVVSAHEGAVASLQAEVSRRLAKSKRKEIVFFIHGYNTTFVDAAHATGKLAHILGGEFVPIMLSWPAGGSKGLMMGYNVDRESGEFAVTDMRKAIRAIAMAKGVEKVHFIAHSRGTDILASVLQLLGTETYVARTSMSARLKVANIVLFAPDIDVDVASSKIFDVASDPDLPYGSGKRPRGPFPQGDLHLTVYSSPNDKALDASQIMFGSIMRLGQLDPKERDPSEVTKAPKSIGLADFIEYEGDGGAFGHTYFLSDPNVSADLVGLIRYRLKAGDPRRPISEIKRPFWLLYSKQTASQ